MASRFCSDSAAMDCEGVRNLVGISQAGGQSNGYSRIESFVFNRTLSGEKQTSSSLNLRPGDPAEGEDAQEQSHHHDA